MNSNKKVAILTRTGTLNFGTILQSYALQEYIKSLGFKVFVVDDSVPRKLYSFKKSSVIEADRKKTLKEYLAYKYDQYKYNKLYKDRFLIEKKIKKFKRAQISYFKIKRIDDLNNEFDIFVSGSDQIWADTAEPKLFRFFMQDFVKNNKLKLSYAVSVGARKYDSHNEPIVIELLREFDFLSVRELSSKMSLTQYTDKNITITCDPVFLIESNHWRKLSGRKKLRGRYIFCYFLSNNSWYYDKLLELNKNLNIDIYIFQNGGLGENCRDYRIINYCSPIDFLNYICNAEFVVTDSYHAVLFSIIFNRTFNVFERFEDLGENTQNGRIKYILERLSLTKYYIKQKDRVNNMVCSYDESNVQLQCFVRESAEFLRTALGKRG